MSKSCLRDLKSDPTEDSTDPQITGPHLEPQEYGGETFHRCTGCGRESIAGPSRILHRDECNA